MIQQELGRLAKDFGLFEDRMTKLATHIRQAHEDVEQVNISSRKISNRFREIERVELTGGQLASDTSADAVGPLGELDTNPNRVLPLTPRE